MSNLDVVRPRGRIDEVAASWIGIKQRGYLVLHPEITFGNRSK